MKKIISAIFLVLMITILVWCQNNKETIQELDTIIPVDQSIMDKIYDMYPNAEWLDCVWDDSQTHIGCIIINQQSYEWLTNVVIFEVDEYKILNPIKEVEQKAWETADFVCGWDCYPSLFSFEWNVLKYKWHILINSGEIFTIEY